VWDGMGWDGMGLVGHLQVAIEYAVGDGDVVGVETVASWVRCNTWRGNGQRRESLGVGLGTGG
jgi:hypothetical protein